jgi:electron transfer flavoprotein beta subunit
MHIVVCIKQVPDSPNIRMDRERMTIIREGLKSIINPLDCVALETALILKKREGSRITALSMGPPQSEEALFEALAYGADHAILLTDKAFAGADTLATSHVLAQAIARLKPFPDLILCGKQTIDSDTGHVGPQIAEELGLPQVCNVNEIHPEGAFLTVKQISDHFLNTIRVSLPVLLTVEPELSDPHHLPLVDIEKAFSEKKITRWGIQDLGLNPQEVGFNGSATKVWKLRKPPQKKQGEVLDGSPQAMVEALIKKLENLSILDEEAEHE